VWRFLKKLEIELPYDPAIPLLGIHTKETRTERDTCTPMFIAALFIIARTWKQPRCPSADEWIRKQWYIYTKINSKWTKDLTLRPETIKLLEENIGKTLSGINHSRILYDLPPRILEKAKINKWDLIKIKSLCPTKETINKVKRQPSE